MARKTWAKVAPGLIYSSYPDHDLLPIRPPGKDEGIHAFERRVTKERVGDTLFQFLCREADDEIGPTEYAKRLDRAIADIQAVRTAVLGYLGEEPGVPIRAECHSDDGIHQVEFDARPWFRQASTEDIVALAQCGWGADYAADAVAEFFEDLNEKVAAMLAYAQQITEAGGTMGFECHVDKESAMKWLEAHRPEVAEAIEEENEE